MDSLTETTLRSACGGVIDRADPLSLDAMFVSMGALPGILKRVGCNATARTVLDAITSLEAFLSDLDTEAIALSEMLAIYRYHKDFKVTPAPTSFVDAPAIEAINDVETVEPKREAPLRQQKSGISREGRITNESLVLPYASSIGAVPLSDKDILRSFQRFDITGEKKLTFLGLKSALELHNDSNKVTDAEIREWLRAHDSGGKGYVDLEDYKRIYSDAARHSGTAKGASRGLSTMTDSNANNRDDILKK